jgi:hypothetical protein
VSLPLDVAFERTRSHSDGRSEVLYSWREQLNVADQTLTSVVPPGDRRVILEFPDPAQWKNQFGDAVDEIRVHIGQSASQIDLLDIDHNKAPPPWVSLPGAGRTCSDRVRIAIRGSWRYHEKTFDGGRIELISPFEYRKRALFYGLAGTGELFRHLGSNARGARFGDLGLGLQIDPAQWLRSLRSLMLDIEVTGQLTHTFYEGIELANQPAADFTAVPYLRFDLRVALEWWGLRRVGLAAAGGFGVGTPWYSGDARMVGALQRSELVELQSLLALLPTRLWFLAGVGWRGGEQHRDYHTGFLGTPSSDREKDAQWYVFLRFRTALE